MDVNRLARQHIIVLEERSASQMLVAIAFVLLGPPGYVATRASDRDRPATWLQWCSWCSIKAYRPLTCMSRRWHGSFLGHRECLPERERFRCALAKARRGHGGRCKSSTSQSVDTRWGHHHIPVIPEARRELGLSRKARGRGMVNTETWRGHAHRRKLRCRWGPSTHGSIALRRNRLRRV